MAMHNVGNSPSAGLCRRIYLAPPPSPMTSPQRQDHIGLFRARRLDRDEEKRIGRGWLVKRNLVVSALAFLQSCVMRASPVPATWPCGKAIFAHSPKLVTSTPVKTSRLQQRFATVVDTDGTRRPEEQSITPLSHFRDSTVRYSCCLSQALGVCS